MQAGADPDAKDKESYVPAQVAAITGRWKVGGGWGEGGRALKQKV